MRRQIIKFLLRIAFVRPDGRVVWVMGQAIMESWIQKMKSLVMWCVDNRHYAERKLSEEQLKKNEQKMEAIIERIPDLMLWSEFRWYFHNYYSRREDFTFTILNSFRENILKHFL
jgi:PAS domain-containing protein